MKSTSTSYVKVRFPVYSVFRVVGSGYIDSYRGMYKINPPVVTVESDDIDHVVHLAICTCRMSMCCAVLACASQEGGREVDQDL
jgi:hypothetical protein